MAAKKIAGKKITKGLMKSTPLPPTTFTKVDMYRFFTPEQGKKIKAAIKKGR